MSKKIYKVENETLGILTPPNETYNGKEIPVVVSTTEGVYVQYRESLKISNSKALPKPDGADISLSG
jgi:hypothetical protein